MVKSPNKGHIHYHYVEQGSEQWLKDREGKFTGSNAARLLSSFGAGTWALNAVGGNTFKGNFYTKRGHLLEDEAILLYNQIRGVTVEHCGYVTNDKFQYALYSPDGFLPDRTVEVKAFNPKKHLAMVKSLSIEIKAQSHFGQLILERKLTDVILYCPQPKDWDEATQGKFPVPIDKQLVIIPIKYDRSINSNFKRILESWND